MRLAETLAFVAVARAGSFTAAARRLGLPKSTLSRQVSRLEEHLGTRLLQRTTRRLSLTETGQAYFERCRDAIAEIEAAERITLDRAERPAGTVRVSAPFDFARDRLAPLIPGFRARYPDIRLGLMLSQHRTDLVEEGFDVALRGGVLPDSGFISRKIADSDVVLCASPAYLERRGRPASPEELVEHDAVVMGPGGRAAPWRMEGPAGMVSIPLEPWLVANEWGFLHRLLLEGLGVGPMLEPDVRRDLAAGRLERVLPDHVLRGGALYAVYPSRHHLSPKVRVFVDYLVEKLGDDLDATPLVR